MLTGKLLNIQKSSKKLDHFFRNKIDIFSGKPIQTNNIHKMP